MSLKNALIKALEAEINNSIKPLAEKDSFRIDIYIKNVRVSGARVISALREIIRRIEDFHDMDGSLSFSISEEKEKIRFSPRKKLKGGDFYDYTK